MSVFLPMAALLGGGSVLDVADVFSTDLYTGNGSTQAITNGIDLSGKGGLVWVKSRGSGSREHVLTDTSRGTNAFLSTNDTGAEGNISGITGFNADGFDLGSDGWVNFNTDNYVGWTFRRAPKFFDVVTYTGDGSATGRTIPHSLGQAPGMIIIKATSTTSDWIVWHRSIGFGAYVKLNSTQSTSGNTPSHVEAVTADDFDLYTGVALSNTTGVDYVAYLFAHDTSDSGIIQCGSYTGNGSSTGPIVNLGWRPQWILYKVATATGDWGIHDIERGLTYNGSGYGNRLEPNTSDAETGISVFVNTTDTGFQVVAAVNDVNGSGETIVYCAIRAEGA